jgi:Ca2+-transporting ATPase
VATTVTNETAMLALPDHSRRDSAHDRPWSQPEMLSGTQVERPWAVPAEAVADALATDPAAGLTAAEAADRLDRVGPNELVERGRKPAWRLLAEQFANTMILVLIAAAVVTAVIGDLKDTAVILAIVVLNAVVGFAQEYRAEQAMAALKAMAAPSVQVVRDGHARLVQAAELVPGDVVLVAQGDLLTADLRLVEAHALRVNEAALTGESQPVTKATEPLPDVDPSVVAEGRNLAFRGTAVTGGRGRAWSWPPAWPPSSAGWPTCSRPSRPAPRRYSAGFRSSAGGWPERR